VVRLGFGLSDLYVDYRLSQNFLELIRVVLAAVERSTTRMCEHLYFVAPEINLMNQQRRRGVQQQAAMQNQRLNNRQGGGIYNKMRNMQQ
jgi:hypothetical protein